MKLAFASKGLPQVPYLTVNANLLTEDTYNQELICNLERKLGYPCFVKPANLGSSVGITKAYTTRVGEGPFPTELKDDIGELLGTRGKEFGTVTSRKRRCGWFDGVLVRQTIKVSGINGIALTKLDVLDELDEIKMCVEYELDGKKINYLPAAVEDQLKIKPIYKTFDGWKKSTSGIKNIDDLPENAKNYIKEVENFIETKISSISTSPERDDTILIENPFEI